jgi:EmrB/QacA subfamily drug resistance transporter
MAGSKSVYLSYMGKQQRLVLVVSILASFVGALDGFIVNIALPTISRNLGGGLVVQQWVVDAYLLTLGSLILIAGSLSDLFGRKRVLWFGLVWFGITSLLCAAAPNGTALIIARGLQGIAGALLVPSSLAMIISAFSGAAQSKAIGIWTAWFSIAALTGPLLGGLIISISSWRWIFAINVFPIAITLWLMRSLEQPERVKSGVRVDFLGASLCALGLGGSVFALIEQAHYGWASPVIYVPFMLGVLVLAAFIRYESTHINPMLPLSLFKVRNFYVGNVATAAIYGGLSMSTFLIVITLQQVGGYNALESGLALLPVTAIMFLLSSRFGALAGRFGPRFFMASGPMIASIGFLLMLRVQSHVGYVSQLLPGVLLFALGLSMTVAPLTSAILSAIDSKQAGIASAVNNAVSRIAGLIAVAALGLLTGSKLSIDGFHKGIFASAGLLLVGGIISAIGIQNTKKQT